METEVLLRDQCGYTRNIFALSPSDHCNALGTVIICRLPAWKSESRDVINLAKDRSKSKKGLPKDGNHYFCILLHYMAIILSSSTLFWTKDRWECPTWRLSAYLPICLSAAKSRSPSSATILEVALLGQFLKKLLNIFIDDVVNEATSGIEEMDQNGRRPIVFIENVTWFGDYPEVTASADLFGHIYICSSRCVVPRFFIPQRIIREGLDISALMNEWTKLGPSQQMNHSGDHRLLGVQVRQKPFNFYL